MSTNDAIARAQNALEEKLAAARQRQSDLAGQVTKRKAFAYIAKIIVAVSGLLMTLDAVKPYNVPVGILISLMVTLDYIFSNQPKLLVFTQAEQAYRRALEVIDHKHSHKLPELLAIKEKDPEGFAGRFVPLLQELLDELHVTRTKIEDAINAADVKALTRLAIDAA